MPRAPTTSVRHHPHSPHISRPLRSKRERLSFADHNPYFDFKESHSIDVCDIESQESGGMTSLGITNEDAMECGEVVMRMVNMPPSFPRRLTRVRRTT